MLSIHLTPLIIIICFVVNPIQSNTLSETPVNTKTESDISLWIDEKQVKQFFSGFPLKIYAILDGNVLPYVLDPNFEKHLPIIPFEVSSVNFTWKSGDNKLYFYDFDQLVSFNEEILSQPIISIEPKGRVPKKAKIFQVFIPCVGNISGTATFTIGLRIVDSETNQNLSGTPLRLKLRKQCADRSPDPECDKKCGNGKCNQNKICECPTGFLGKFCESALCYPQCMNGGSCIAPGVCNCSEGFQGFHCEGGICREKCLNGGKCIQKDMCSCRKGYYGPRCEYSKCVIPCLNGGRCVGVNRCRCRRGFSGSQCESQTEQNSQTNQKHKSVSKKRPKKKFV